MSKDNNQVPRNFIAKFAQRVQKTLYSYINAIAELISTSVHIPEVAIGPIIGSLITATTTLIIGFLTISNLFSEQFLYRPLQLQDDSANYKLELDRYRQTVLTDYLNQISKLILLHSVNKLQRNPFLLRSITQETLGQLDGERKRYLIMFLNDASLLTFYPLLEGANLTEGQFDHLQLYKSDFRGANLSKANFEQTNLHKSNLNKTKLNNANLVNADLRGASLLKADLTNTNFLNACYDVFTEFDPSFNPKKAKMQLIEPFDSCEGKSFEQHQKVL